MADVKLENRELRVGVNLHGAELVSLVRKSDDREYMWSGDPAFWGRVSPVLFPFVGKLKDGGYVYKGNVISGVPQHGYARDSEFVPAERTEDTAWFELVPDETWKSRYPFDFLLRIGYRLEGASVHVMWTVKNTSSEDMFFSIGAHPAFVMPEGCSKVGCALDFHIPSNRLCAGELNEDGLLKPERRSFPLSGGKLILTEELFDRDALIIDSADLHTVSLEGPDGKAFIQVRFDAPQLGIWSPVGKKAPFVCIEPWFGRSDRVGYEGDLSGREYGNTLLPGHSFNKEYVIDIL